MHKNHTKELIKLAKEDLEYDWGYLHEFVITKIRHMYEYYEACDNVYQTYETRNEILSQLRYVLGLENQITNIFKGDTRGADGTDSITKIKTQFTKEDELYKEIYKYIGENLRNWWD